MSILNMLLGGAGGGDSVITEYETGVYAPTYASEQNPVIPFVNVHTEAPAIILLADDTGLTPRTSMQVVWFFADWTKIFGGAMIGTANGYGEIRDISNTRNYSETMLNSSSALQSYVTATEFKPKRSGTVYYDNARTYKWIALWMPSE